MAFWHTAPLAVREQRLTLTIDACVQVDNELVRRLVDLELGESPRAGRAMVKIDCVDERQRVRVTEAATPANEPALERTIDLRTSAPSAGIDVRSRELALVVAELVRRRGSTPAPPPPNPTPVAPVPAPLAPEGIRDTAGNETTSRWPWQAAALFAYDWYAGGQSQVGADLALRWHMGRWLVAQTRIGARHLPNATVPEGELQASAYVGALALGIDIGSIAHAIDVAVFAEAQAQLVRFESTNHEGASVDRETIPALVLALGPAITIALAPHVGVVAEAYAGRAIYGVDVRDQDAHVASVSGLCLSASVGIATTF